MQIGKLLRVFRLLRVSRLKSIFDTVIDVFSEEVLGVLMTTKSPWTCALTQTLPRQALCSPGEQNDPWRRLYAFIYSW